MGWEVAVMDSNLASGIIDLMGRKLSRTAKHFNDYIAPRVKIWRDMIRSGWKASDIDFTYDNIYAGPKQRSPYVRYRMKDIIRDCYKLAGEEYSDT